MSTPNQPFLRVMAFMAALSAAMAKPGITQQLALAEVGPYVSRGKGQTKLDLKPVAAEPTRELKTVSA